MFGGGGEEFVVVSVTLLEFYVILCHLCINRLLVVNCVLTLL